MKECPLTGTPFVLTYKGGGIFLVVWGGRGCNSTGVSPLRLVSKGF